MQTPPLMLIDRATLIFVPNYTHYSWMFNILKILHSDNFIFTNSLNIIYLLHNHLHHPSSQHNHLDKISLQPSYSTSNTSITKSSSKKIEPIPTIFTQMLEPLNYDPISLSLTSFHLIGHRIPCSHASVPTSTQHDKPIHNKHPTTKMNIAIH